jgi:aminoglycoside N3'-acetyltransferase
MPKPLGRRHHCSRSIICAIMALLQAHHLPSVLMATILTRQDIQQALRSLDLASSPVCLHTSFRSFGSVAGGTVSLIDAFLREHCTLLVPSFSWSFAVPPPPDQHFSRNGWNYTSYPGPTSGLGRIYTPQATEVDSDMGILAAAVLAHPDHLRGDHPLCSFSALGHYAAELISAQRADDVYAPLTMLSKLNGFVLLIGVGLDKLTLLHLAEKQAGRRLFRRWANNLEGQRIAVEVGGCSAGFPKLEAELEAITQTLRVGPSVWKLLPARPVLACAIAAIRANPEITHCGDPTCERCTDAIAGGPLLEN